MRARYIIERLCEAESALHGTLFLNSSDREDWLPAPIYIPADAGNANEEFVRQWSHHLEFKMQDNPDEVVNELVRRYGLVVVTSGPGGKPPTVVSRKKQLGLSADNMAELEDTFGLDEESSYTVFWKPSLASSPVEIRTAVIFHGEYDYADNRPDRDQRQRGSRGSVRHRRGPLKTEEPKGSGSKWTHGAGGGVSPEEEAEFEKTVGRGVSGLATKPGGAKYAPPTPSVSKGAGKRNKPKSTSSMFIKGRPKNTVKTSKVTIAA